MSSKIKDGLFLGDIDAAQDAEFLQLNGISHIINCVPRQVPNIFQQSLSLSYVSCDLEEVLRRSFFDVNNREFMGIVNLIDRALERTESVLVHSLHGINRGPSVIIGYLMVKYCWGVDKAYDFLLTKRPDIKPHESYINQLCTLESQLQTLHSKGRLSEQQLFEWHAHRAATDSDEVVLVHTYLNSSSKSPDERTSLRSQEATKAPRPHADQRHQRRLTWIDQSTQLKKLYPSLMIRPERPPNHSYSDMVPANGWVDLLTPTPMTKEGGVSARRSVADRDVGDDESGDPTVIVTRQSRLSSFSVPRHREIVVESQTSLSPSSPSGERDDQDLVIEVSNPQTSQPPRHTRPRTSSSAGPRPLKTQTPRQVQSGSVHRGSAMSSSTMASSSVGRMKGTTTSMLSGRRDFDISAKTTTTMGRTTPRTPVKSVVPSIATPSSRASSDIQMTGNLLPPRANVPTDSVALPTSSSAFSRRAVTDMEATSRGGANGTSRPRTAPPRLRRKESELSDVLGSSRMNVTDAAERLATALNRVTLEAPQSMLGRRLSGGEFATTTPNLHVTGSGPARLQKPTGRSVPPPSRPKTVRAHWK
ncbi:hypothetical protein PINS_up015723 [Pythium insidiosum]|nr:hypothetical protein PINS_up013314 [Pythium insidiosum]GLE06476.1 hypothetical protein PINS_up015723 [Pythium insidiosum]